MKMRKCTGKCGRELPLTEEYFHRNKNNAEGFQNKCKDCRAIDSKKYWLKINAREAKKKTPVKCLKTNSRVRFIEGRTALKRLGIYQQSIDVPAKIKELGIPIIHEDEYMGKVYVLMDDVAKLKETFKVSKVENEQNAPLYTIYELLKTIDGKIDKMFADLGIKVG